MDCLSTKCSLLSDCWPSPSCPGAHNHLGGWPPLVILAYRRVELCESCCCRKSSYSPSSKIKSGGCLLEATFFTLQRKEERLNVIYIPVTGIGRQVGFEISNGLKNFEEAIKEIVTLDSNRNIN